MSAYALRELAVELMEDDRRVLAMTLAERQDPFDQMRFMQGQIDGIRLAIERLKDVYNRVGD